MMRSILLCLLLSTRFVNGASKPSKEFLHAALELGAYMDSAWMNMRPVKDFGKSPADLLGFFRLRFGISLWEDVQLEPSFGVLIPWRNGTDGGDKTIYAQTALTVSFPVFSPVYLRLGPGIYHIFIYSSEQTIVLNNGTGTSSFYKPSRMVGALLLSAQAGLGVHFSDLISFWMDVYALNAADKLKRYYNVSATLGIAL